MMYIEYCMIFTKMIGNNKYVGNVPTDASSIRRSIVLDDNIIIKIASTDKDVSAISFNKYLSKIFILSEFWDYLKVRKKYWLAPIVLFLLLFGALIVLTEGSAIAPFIYAIF